MTTESVPESGRAGRFGAFGGQYVPETLMPACAELEEAWATAQADADFQAELDGLLREYAGPADAADRRAPPQRRA